MSAMLQASMKERGMTAYAVGTEMTRTGKMNRDHARDLMSLGLGKNPGLNTVIRLADAVGLELVVRQKQR